MVLGAIVTLSLFGAAGLAQASSVTSGQLSAIVGLLQAFGADQGVVANVAAALGSTSMSSVSGHMNVVTTQSTTPLPNTSIGWLIATNGPKAIQLLQDASTPANVISAFFDTPRAYVAASTTAAYLPNSTSVDYFTSYAAFAAAVAQRTISKSAKAIMYDCELWPGSDPPLTPANEIANPVLYAQKAAYLAHHNGLKLIFTPAVNLSGVGDGRKYDLFLGMHVLDGSVIATTTTGLDPVDVIELQAQEFEGRPQALEFATEAAAQVRAASSTVPIFMGIATKPSGYTVTGAQLLSDYYTTLPYVNGYWLNMSLKSKYCPACTDSNATSSRDFLETISGAVPTAVSNQPTATLTASSQTVVSGQPVTLAWSSQNAPSCNGGGFSTGKTRATSGSVTVTPTQTTTYALTCGTSDSPTPTGAAVPFAVATVTVNTTITGAVSVSGKNLLRDGQPWTPHGFVSIAFVAPPAAQTGAFLNAYTNFSQAELEAMKKNWNADTVRFQVSQPGLDPQNKLFDSTFLETVKNAVRLARSIGLNVIVSVQDEPQSGETQTPTALYPNAATLRVWSQLAPLFNNDPGIMYEILNEPYPAATPTNWTTWQARMNAAISTIRGTGSKNVIIADGLNLAQDLDGVLPLTDPANEVAYAAHPYFHSSTDQQSQTWENHFGSLASTAPVIVTEWTTEPQFYCDSTTPTAAAAFLRYLNDRGIGLTAFAYDFNGKTFGSAAVMGVPTTFADGLQCGQSNFGPGTLIQNWYLTGALPPAPTPLTATCTVSPASISTGGSATWTAVPVGGVAPYTYVWSGTGTLTGSTKSVSKTYATSGTKTASVVVADSAGATFTSTCPDLTVTGGTAGVCGTATGGTYSWDAPPTTGLCSAGTKTSPTSNAAHTQWSWGCTGLNGGATASCTASETYLSLTGSSITPTCAVGGTVQTFTGYIINAGNASTNTAFNNYFETNNASQGSGVSGVPVAAPIPSPMLGIAAGGSNRITVSKTYTAGGANGNLTATRSIRVCANMSGIGSNDVLDPINVGSTCGPWTDVTVLPAGQTCSAAAQ